LTPQPWPELIPASCTTFSAFRHSMRCADYTSRAMDAAFSQTATCGRHKSSSYACSARSSLPMQLSKVNYDSPDAHRQILPHAVCRATTVTRCTTILASSTGPKSGPQVDSAIYFAQDHQAHRLVERQRRAQAELRPSRLALAARQAQPRQYRRHSPVHARSWQSKLRSPQQCSLPRAKCGPAAPLPSLPLKQISLPDPAAEATDIGPQVSFDDSDVRADQATSDAASAASTITLVAALMTLVRFVRGTLAPPGRRRYTKLPARHTQETRRPVLLAATDQWPPAFALGRWSCAPRDCRQVRSSMTMHHGCTDGTGTRPSFEPR
jgi:hypothetical protein